MRTVTLDDLRDKTPELLELVQAGETLDVKDGERFVATFGPPREEVETTTFDEHIDRLIREGAIQRSGAGQIPLDVALAPPVQTSGASVLQGLLEERESSRR